MEKLFLTPGLMFAFVGFAQAVEITNTNATGTTFKFSATLNAPLTAGNKVKIDFGKGGLKAMTCSAKTCTLLSNALPTGISTATYKIGIYDAKNVLQGSTSDGTYVITSNSSAPVSNYTKIANDGSELSDSAKLGSNPKDWACTKDNKTGLIWEVKTTDGGLRDMNWYYSWYEPDASKNSGDAGYTDTVWTTRNCSTKDNCNTYEFIKAVNAKGLCGKNDWRLPTKDELLSIVKSGSVPAINIIYFPNTVSSTNYFWSSSITYVLQGTAATVNGTVWDVDFNNGDLGYEDKGNVESIRLVH